jgi:cell division protein FtsW (lipid II flippase)
LIKKIPLVVILVSLIATAQYFFLSTYFANFVEYKANLISKLISKEDQAIDSENFFSAEIFCEVWTGKAIDLVDCETGRDIKNLNYLIADSQKDAYKKALIYAVTKNKQYIELRDSLVLKEQEHPELTQLVNSFDDRIFTISSFLNQNSEISPDQLTYDFYKKTFNILLLINGQLYSNTKDKDSFKVKSWDIAQLINNPKSIIQKNNHEIFAFHWAKPLIASSSFLILLTSFLWFSWIESGAILIYLFITSFSLLIIGDASANFALTSHSYSINPMDYQLFRALKVVLFSYFFLLFIMFFKKAIIGLFGFISKYPYLITWIVFALITFCYFFFGPAIGSEVLKIGISFTAAILMVQESHILYIVRKYALSFFSLKNLLSTFKNLFRSSQNSNKEILLHIMLPAINFSIFAFSSLVISAFVKHDLGGTLISSFILIATLFLVFGSIPAIASLSLMGISAYFLSATPKLQDRIELMLQPMNAHISDFAKLIGFSEAAGENGFGLGHIQWCNQEGSCLPLQVLSDYVPTVLVGAIGPVWSFVIFLFLCAYFALMAGLLFWRFIILNSTLRMLGIFGFFLFCATFIQNIVTFLGNWRYIPLTGLGVPLVSVGLSSFLAPTLALSFLILTSRTQKKLIS